MTDDAADPADDRVSGIPPVGDLVAELKGMDDGDRHLRLIEAIWAIAETDRGTKAEMAYRDAFAANGLIGKTDFKDLLADAKRERRANSKAEDLAVVRTPRTAAARYRVGADGCLYWIKDNGDDLMIATCAPQVIGCVVRDDGSGDDPEQVIRIRVTLPTGVVGEVGVTPREFADPFTWTVKAVGPRGVILPVPNAAGHFRAAAQLRAPDDLPTQVVYTHTGWRILGNRWRYLSGSGALGADGLDEAVTVELARPMDGYALPDPAVVSEQETRDAIRASLDILDVAPDAATAPTLGAGYRAPLPEPPEGTVFVHGKSGALKSQLTALAVQHFGSKMDDKHLPGSWESTANALEERAFQLNHTLFLIDDYNPQGEHVDAAKLAKAADRVIRGGANQTGRGRLRADGTPRPERPARAQLISSGEDIPPGYSLRARMYIAPLGPGDIDTVKLTACQERAADGVYGRAMAGYVRHVARRLDDDEEGFRAGLKERHLKARAQAGAAGQHLRVPDMVASLFVGWSTFLDYAADIGAITADERAEISRRVWKALTAGAAEQQSYQTDADPVQVYLRAVKTAVVTGRAHFTSLSGDVPPSADAWGWKIEVRGGTPVDVPQGERIGWVDGTEVYLDPSAAYEIARRHARAAGTELNVTEQTLRNRLREGGHLVDVERRGHKPNCRPGTAVRRDCSGCLVRTTVRLPGDAARRPPVLHVAASTLGVGDAVEE